VYVKVPELHALLIDVIQVKVL